MSIALGSPVALCRAHLYIRPFLRAVFAMAHPRPFSTLSFELANPGVPQLGPRLGKLTLRRDDGQPAITMDTPNIMACTSRGVVPHLTRDHYVAAGDALSWVHVPFESL